MKKFKKILLTVFICILAAVFAFSAYKVASGLIGYHKANKVYDEMQNQYVDTKPRDTLDTAAVPDTGDMTVSPVTEDENASPISVDFEALNKDHPDVVGWLYCPDTPMNYPVAQSSDNDHYLRRDLNGNYLVTGTIFADFRCEGAGVDPNYIIFGHNMDNGTIFGMLKNYAEEEYYEEHPSFWYLTPEGDFKIDVYAAVTLSADDKIYEPIVEGNALYDYLETLAAKSGFDSGIEIEDGDTFMTLSTCSYAYKDARFVLVGRVTKLESQD